MVFRVVHPPQAITQQPTLSWLWLECHRNNITQYINHSPKKRLGSRQPVDMFVNSSSHEQNGRHFAENFFKYIFVNEKFCILINISLTFVPNDIFKYIFANEKFCILINISLNFVPKCQVNNIPGLVQIMAWQWISDKPLSEPMLTQFTDIYASLGGNELTHWGRDKWTPFRRRHFQMHFLQWKCLNSDYNFTEVCS